MRITRRTLKYRKHPIPDHNEKEAIGADETLCGLNQNQLVGLENIVRESIVSATAPPEDIIPEKIPHDDFAQWLKLSSRRKAVELFTTNYDILIERSLERMRVPMFDGFVGSYRPFFHSESLDDLQLLPPQSGFACGNYMALSTGK